MWFFKVASIALSVFSLHKGISGERVKFGLIAWLILSFVGIIFLFFGFLFIAVFGDGSLVSVAGFFASFPLLVGLSIFSLATFFFVRSLKRSSTIRRLQKSGIRVTGRIDKFRIAKRIQNPSNPSVKIEVVVDGTDQYSGQYISDTIGNIGGLLASDYKHNAVAVDVFISKSNPKQYYVDVSGIPALSLSGIKDLVAGRISDVRKSRKKTASQNSEKSTRER